MPGQVSSTLEVLGHAIDGLDLAVDSVVLVEAFALADRLNAKLLAAAGEYDAAELWHNDGATSMTAWLRHQTRHSGRDAARCTRTARRLRQLPVTAAAYRDGGLSGGQIQAIVANLKDRTVGLFAHHEAELVPELAGLSAGETAVAMQDWARRADAVLGGDPEPALPVRSLHLSCILDGRRELSGSFDPEGGAVIATALRLAQTHDVEGEPARSPAQRRGDALVDVCRRFLDHQQDRRGGRHRPHLNVITTLDDLQNRGHGRLVDGTILDATTIQRLVCDAGVHRVVTNGRSSILETTAPPPAPSPPPCSTPWSSATATAASLAATGPPTGPKPTTSAGLPAAAPPPSTTSCWSVPGTTTCSTRPAGTPNSSPTTPSRSPTPTATPTPPPPTPDAHRPSH
jgi:Domain of unknown function (DUF222)